VQILQVFLQERYDIPSVQKNNSSTEKKQCVFKYSLKATLNFALSFLRIVSLVVKFENLYTNTECTSLKAIWFGIWSMKMKLIA